jgi:hypothetical protein
MIEHYRKALFTLSGYCKAKEKWDVDFDDPPYTQLLQVAAKYYGEIWSFDQFDGLLNFHLSQLKSKTITTEIVQQIIDDIQRKLRNNMEKVFLIIPLKGAWIKSTIDTDYLAIVKTTFDNFGLVPQSFAEIDIVQEVASITGFTEERISRAFNNIKESRAKDFLSCPLLIIKEFGQYDVIGNIDYSHYILKYLNLFIRLIASYNRINPEKKYLGWTKADHFFSIDEKHNYHHYPLREIITLNYDLSFMTDPSNQEILKKIIAIFKTKGTDELQNIYFRSMRFYNSSLSGSEFSKDAVSQRLLNTLIAAETLMSFSTRGEKKSKLAHVMIGLAKVKDAKKVLYYKAVIEAYLDRSSLLHSGKQELSKYIIDIETDKKESESLSLLSELMSYILIKFPDFYREIAFDGLSEQYLLRWQQKIKPFIPIIKYNGFQKIISRLIVLLQRFARLKPDTGINIGV